MECLVINALFFKVKEKGSIIKFHTDLFIIAVKFKEFIFYVEFVPDFFIF